MKVKWLSQLCKLLTKQRGWGVGGGAGGAVEGRILSRPDKMTRDRPVS
jgi:hypothetical protein